MHPSKKLVEGWEALAANASRANHVGTQDYGMICCPPVCYDGDHKYSPALREDCFAAESPESPASGPTVADADRVPFVIPTSLEKVKPMKGAFQSALLVSMALMTLTAVFAIWTRDTSLITWMSLWCVTMFLSSQGLWQAKRIESLEAE